MSYPAQPADASAAKGLTKVRSINPFRATLTSSSLAAQGRSYRYSATFDSMRYDSPKAAIMVGISLLSFFLATERPSFPDAFQCQYNILARSDLTPPPPLSSLPLTRSSDLTICRGLAWRLPCSSHEPVPSYTHQGRSSSVSRKSRSATRYHLAFLRREIFVKMSHLVESLTDDRLSRLQVYLLWRY